MDNGSVVPAPRAINLQIAAFVLGVVGALINSAKGYDEIRISVYRRNEESNLSWMTSRGTGEYFRRQHTFLPSSSPGSQNEYFIVRVGVALLFFRR